MRASRRVPTFYALVDALTGRESDVEKGLTSELRIAS
jgi:hypothetical protein